MLMNNYNLKERLKVFFLRSIFVILSILQNKLKEKQTRLTCTVVHLNFYLND